MAILIHLKLRAPDPALRDISSRRDDVLDVERLLEVAVDERGVELQQGEVVVRGHDEDQRAQRQAQLAEGVEEGVAVHARHHQVDDDAAYVAVASFSSAATPSPAVSTVSGSRPRAAVSMPRMATSSSTIRIRGKVVTSL